MHGKWKWYLELDPSGTIVAEGFSVRPMGLDVKVIVHWNYGGWKSLECGRRRHSDKGTVARECFAFLLKFRNKVRFGRTEQKGKIPALHLQNAIEELNELDDHHAKITFRINQNVYKLSNQNKKKL